MVEVSAAEYFSNRLVLTSDETRTFFLIPLGPVIQQFGRVTDISTSAPIAGATVSINGRYRATTDASGNYNVTGRLDHGDTSYTFVSADGYETYTRHIRGNPAQSFRLRPIERILPGESWRMTIQPDDSLCFNNYYEPSYALPGAGHLCGPVHVMAPSGGMLEVEAVSTVDGSHPPLIVEVWGVNAPCCSDEMHNPMSVKVSTGAEVVVWVQMPEGSPTSQSFNVKTAMSP